MTFKKKKNDKRKSEASHRSKVVLNENTAFVANESYKALRTNVIFTVPNEEKCNIILFTSSVPGEGKTTTCVNTAISFAQTGAKVLIIEADMRRPKVGECFLREDEVGISNVLIGMAKADEAISHIEEYNVDMIAAGQIPPNPTELLASGKIKKVLDELKEKYDYIFIDTPPVNTVTDAVLLTKYVHGVIIVIRSRYTMRQALLKAVRTLEFSNAKILGVVVNDAYVERRYTRYNGYKKYGDYYQSYNTDKKKKRKGGKQEEKCV